MIYSVIGFIGFTVFMVFAHRRNMKQSVYIPVCLASAASAAMLFKDLFVYYLGKYDLYFYIVTTLVIGLITDFVIRKTVSQKN